MPLIAVTRLRLRSSRYLVPFLWYAIRSQRQARRAEGNLGTDVRHAKGAFWTLTVWRDRAAMRAYMLAGAHRVVMPRLQTWCDEASVADWEHDAPPPWAEAETHLAQHGRVSAVKYPSPAHVAGATLGTVS
jgi:hypothetical protein